MAVVHVIDTVRILRGPLFAEFALRGGVVKTVIDAVEQRKQIRGRSDFAGFCSEIAWIQIPVQISVRVDTRLAVGSIAGMLACGSRMGERISLLHVLRTAPETETGWSLHLRKQTVRRRRKRFGIGQHGHPERRRVVGTGGMGQLTVEGVGIHVEGRPELLHVCGTGNLPRFSPGRVQRGKKHPRKDCNNGNNHEELYQCEIFRPRSDSPEGMCSGLHLMLFLLH